MLPVFDTFDFFERLLPLLVVLVPVIALIGRGRRVVLTVAGLALLWFVAPRLALFHLVFWLLVAAAQPLVAATGERRHGLWVMWTALLVPLTPLVAWKVWPIEFVVRFNVWTDGAFVATSPFLGAVDRAFDVIGPIGLSFAAFRAADLLVKSNLGLVERQEPGRVLATGLFPPLLVVGPIATWKETAATVEARVPLDAERLVAGVTQILTGLFKVFVLAFLLDWSPEILAFYADNPPWRLWIGLIAYGWFFYVNFAGYSDLAIGASTLLGADVRPNFDRPYRQTDPSAFWNSWHISLTSFLRTNVFTPIVAGHPERMYVGTVVTMMLIALWHGVTWATFVFGVYHSVALVGHRMLQARRPASANQPVRWAKSVGVFVWFTLSLPLLQLDLGESIDFYAAVWGWPT
ncbi:MAG: MBOAT family O-acyltransferase [Actinomycetota bacterium]